jgi:formylglycine-generating enzyme required for sulfatase activity
LSEAAEAWTVVKDTTSIAALEAFLARFKDTYYADLARLRLEELKNKVAMATPPQAKPASATAPQCDGIKIRNVKYGIEIGNVKYIAHLEVAPIEDNCLKAGAGKSQWFKDCVMCPEMVVVPAGNFMMGSPASEPARTILEDQVRVSIAAPFAVGRVAVTFDEWDACAADGGCNRYKPGNTGSGRGKNPVINVSWDDAKAYVEWLSRKTGKIYRLLSEAEREYVTRAGTTTPFWWGSSITPKQANYDGNYTYGGGPKGESRLHTVRVDSFEPNPWGPYNIHGNVWEWVEDCWNDSNRGQPGDGQVRMTGECNKRVLRGGSWNSSPQYLRSTYRGAYPIGTRITSFGFRVARTLN